MNKSVSPKLNDADLLAGLKDFGTAAMAGICKDQDDLHDALSSGGFRLLQGYTFKIGTAIQSAQSAVIGRAIKLLGPQLGAEKDVDDILWQVFVDSLANDSMNEGAFIQSFKEELTSYTQLVRRVIAPNYLFRVSEGIGPVVIGPVAIRSGADVVDEVQAWNENPRWRIAVSPKSLGMNVVDGVAEIGVSDTIFDVSVQASQQNADEEAFWLIDVATSLVRLTIPRWNSFAPAIGKPEALSVSPSDGRTNTIKIVDKNLKAGGWSLPGFYLVEASQYSAIRDPKFQNLANSILNPKSGSVAERLSQAFGWLTRGRQSTERAQRFLFFFTAIEALLSSDDKNSPVIQTIARHAGVVWSNDVTIRAQLADLIKKLYSARSALVHAGSRKVSRSDADTIQQIAETLAFRIAAEMDVETPYKDLVQELGAASHGSPWRP